MFDTIIILNCKLNIWGSVPTGSKRNWSCYLTMWCGMGTVQNDPKMRIIDLREMQLKLFSSYHSDGWLLLSIRPISQIPRCKCVPNFTPLRLLSVPTASIYRCYDCWRMAARTCINLILRRSYKGKLVVWGNWFVRGPLISCLFAAGPDRDPLPGRKSHPPTYHLGPRTWVGSAKYDLEKDPGSDVTL